MPERATVSSRSEKSAEAVVGEATIKVAEAKGRTRGSTGHRGRCGTKGVRCLSNQGGRVAAGVKPQANVTLTKRPARDAARTAQGQGCSPRL